jgi:hypothetical protein
VLPGWYPDPYSNGLLRWWDGAQWTPYTSPMQPVAAMFAPDPAADLHGEESAGRRAALALAIGAAFLVLEYLVFAVTFGHALHHLINDIRANVRDVDNGVTPRPVSFGGGSGFLAIDLFGLPTLVVQILLMIWLYRAATIARRAQLPSRREPIWAILGFIVPVVSLWFPYQVAVGALPPGDLARRAVAIWWGSTLGQGAAVIPIVIASYFSTTTAVIFAIVLCALPILAARSGRTMIAASIAAHRALLGVPATA